MSVVSTGASAAGRAWEVAARVVDPELPMLTLADLGVLREVEARGGAIVVAITPTYSGCPAMATMRNDLVRALRDEGFVDVQVRIVLEPAWTTDWITPAGRAALAQAGISPPGAASTISDDGSARGPVPLQLLPTRRAIRCPRCGAEEVALVSEFGSTACRALYRCEVCLEPFDHVKEL